MNLIQKYKIKKEIKEETNLQAFLIKVMNLYLTSDDVSKRNRAIDQLNHDPEECRQRIEDYRLSLNIDFYMK